jgi:sugar phosphate isomerase/epimerase
MIQYSGFADEAGKDLDSQIRATKELGWKYIESRSIGSKNLATLSEAEFEELRRKLDESGVAIHCYGSGVANWGKSPLKEEDFEASVQELESALPRMQILGTKYLRGMSFAVPQGRKPDSEEIETQVYAKVKRLVEKCEDAGVIYVHENCMTYGGLSYEHFLKLEEHVSSPNFRLCFDMSNVVNTFDYREYPPKHIQDPWEFYQHTKDFIEHVHIKDSTYLGQGDGVFPETEHKWPGEGDGMVPVIIRDLLERGYDRVLSIEPHLGAVFHDPDSEYDEDGQYRMYVEYGRRLMSLVERIRSDPEIR